MMARLLKSKNPIYGARTHQNIAKAKRQILMADGTGDGTRRGSCENLTGNYLKRLVREALAEYGLEWPNKRRDGIASGQLIVRDYCDHVDKSSCDVGCPCPCFSLRRKAAKSDRAAERE